MKRHLAAVMIGGLIMGMPVRADHALPANDPRLANDSPLMNDPPLAGCKLMSISGHMMARYRPTLIDRTDPLTRQGLHISLVLEIARLRGDARPEWRPREAPGRPAGMPSAGPPRDIRFRPG